MAEATRSADKSVTQSVVETLEALVMALVLAFVFRAFVVEAFIIPTGSMADTLRGAHFRLTCPVCGHTYNFGFIPESYVHPQTNRPYPQGYMPPQPVHVYPSRLRSRAGTPLCPRCGAAADNSDPRWVRSGDRILVLKYLYHFAEPDTWDVVVFKNPSQPSENYIKRLIGRPGETIELIDGDVYINGAIARKPEAVQEVLWICAFDNDYQPAADGAYRHRPWPSPLRPAEANSGWLIDPAARRLEFAGGDPALLRFDPERLETVLRSFVAYNGLNASNDPYSSDLKVAFDWVPADTTAQVAIELTKYGRTYRAELHADGTGRVIDPESGQIYLEARFAPVTPGRATPVAFAVVDHCLQLDFSARREEYRGPSDPAAWGYTSPLDSHSLPAVALEATGAGARFEHLALYRDTHYLNSHYGTVGRGSEGNPISLGPDEFFVLGDNSPQSSDSRFWTSPGVGNHGRLYPKGIVPRDFLIGRAFFVYWPAAYRLHDKHRFALIPNVGQMRFIR